MITILFFMSVHPGREEEFAELAGEAMRSTLAEDEGCVMYSIQQQADNPREFVLVEQWRDEAAMQAHVERLFASIGRERFFGFFERTRAQRYVPLP